MPLIYEESKNLSILHEGCKLHVYLDSKGKATWGIGCYLDRGGVPALFKRFGIDYQSIRSGKISGTIEQVNKVFAYDLSCAIDNAHIDIESIAPQVNFDELPNAACLVLVDMAFQMGGGGLLNFKHMLTAIGQSDWLTAAEELLDSKYAIADTPFRARQNAALLRACSKVPAEKIAELVAKTPPIDLVQELWPEMSQPSCETHPED